MIRRSPESSRTYTLFPYPTLCRALRHQHGHPRCQRRRRTRNPRRVRKAVIAHPNPSHTPPMNGAGPALVPPLFAQGAPVMSELVREIVEVNAAIDGDEVNPLLIVEVEGIAPTLGWHNVRLDHHVYITPPDDR